MISPFEKSDVEFTQQLKKCGRWWRFKHNLHAGCERILMRRALDEYANGVPVPWWFKYLSRFEFWLRYR